MTIHFNDTTPPKKKIFHIPIQILLSQFSHSNRSIYLHTNIKYYSLNKAVIISVMFMFLNVCTFYNPLNFYPLFAIKVTEFNFIS